MMEEEVEQELDAADADEAAGHVRAAQPAVLAAPARLNKAVDPKDRLTTPYLTKYERARILGTRALQIR